MKISFARFQILHPGFAFTVLVAFAPCLAIGCASAQSVQSYNQTIDSRNATPLTIGNAPNLSTTFSTIAKEVGPAVVNINTEILPPPNAHLGDRADMQNRGSGDDNGGEESQNPGSGMQDFFNRFFGGNPNMGGQSEPEEERGLGSGFIVDTHGYIVTNNHVIDKADRIYVKLTTDPPNDQGHRATVVGVDKETDLAVIKIDVGHPLPTVKLGNSDAAQVGDSVEAIGSPFDLSQTVTAGIVSAKNRNITGSIGGQYKHYIQTDAAINPGNSGGPLLNMDGQVIAVNTALLTQSNGYMGIGFAMPSNTVVDVYNQLIGPEHKVIRGSIGISFQTIINSAVAKMYDAGSGVLISTVVPGKAAAKAGLLQNDVIVSIDGKPVKDGDDLVNIITPRRPGTTVSIGYLRHGKQMTATCGIDLRTDQETALNGPLGNSRPEAQRRRPSSAILGLTVTDLPEDAPTTLHGVIIRSVTPGSFADELNPPVGPGLVIESINRKPIRNTADFDAVVSTLRSGEDVVLQVAAPNRPGEAALTGGVLP